LETDNSDLLKLKKVIETKSPRANIKVHDDYVGIESLHSSAENLIAKPSSLHQVASRQRIGHKTTLSQAKPTPFSQMKIEDASFEVTNDSRLPLKISDAKLLHVLEFKKEKEKMLN